MSFTGLSAFPLTPLHDDVVDEAAYVGLIERLAASGVDSITALGSTGAYAYLRFAIWCVSIPTSSRSASRLDQ